MKLGKNLQIFLFTMVLIFVVGGVWAFLQKSKSSSSDIGMAASKSVEPTIASGNNLIVSEGNYISYSDGVLEKYQDKRRVLFFYANWCPVCRPADIDFMKNHSKFPDDTVLIRVNYNDSDTDDEERGLAKKYSITYQHTFLQIDSSGKEVTKWNGGQITELLANIK